MTVSDYTGAPLAGAADGDPTTTDTDVLLASPDGYLYDKHYDAKNHHRSGWLNLRP